MGYYVKIHPENPQQHKIDEAVNVLEKGGLVIFPTDTIYAIGASVNSPRALDALAKFKNIKLNKANFSFAFYDLSQISQYTKQFDTATFKLLKRNLPGAYTFILEANNNVGKIFKNKKRSVGIRVPANNIIRNLVKTLEHPIAATSLHHEDKILEYPTDAELIYEEYKNRVDCVIDGGAGGNIASTVVDLTSGVPELMREGVGTFENI